MREGKEMMKWIFVFLAGIFLFGCASDSEWTKHDTIFASGAHMSYSMWGYKNPNAKAQKLSDAQNWWGTPIQFNAED